ncbi:MAG: hypothetical protein JWM80_5934 [Cyanobacteria bacterium RYN_339]|nr:hypothetical protein [Cyanobacteria bacterium RYN_339]
MERLVGIDIRRLGSDLLDVLTEAFQNDGWETWRSNGTDDVDLIVSKGDCRYVVDLKVAREGRKQVLESLWANAYLRTRLAAVTSGAEPLPIVGTTALSDRMINDLEQYVARYAPNEAYGLIDARGRLELSGPGLPQLRYPAEGTSGLQGLHLASRPLELFSDLNQWMLKVMLAHRLPQRMLTAPRGRIRKTLDLAAQAKVSLPSARRLVTALKSEGYLAIRPNSYEIINTRELMDRWSSATQRPVAEVGMRFTFPPSSPDDQLRRALNRYARRRAGPSGDLPWDTKRAALGLFTAAAALELGFVHGAATHLFLEDPSADVLQDLGLTRAKSGERVDVFIRRPSWKESTFRGAISHDGVPATDVIQTWLDVGAHPARGSEQAAYIWDQMLAPNLLRED